MIENFQTKVSSSNLYVEKSEGIENSDKFPISENFKTNNLIIKRITDLALSAFFMIIIGWWLFPLIAMAIKLDSKGPVFFKQTREGLNNTTFKCLKFRTMVINKEADTKQATKNDPRITKVGRILRKTSLDELPQLFNVIYGNMSLVGPRPHPLKLNEVSAEVIPGFKNRHLTKPGITGLAQAKGYRGETQVANSMYFRYKLDMYYIKTWSPLLDVKIMWMTIVSILTDNENAH